jgi:hypothetical protein
VQTEPINKSNAQAQTEEAIKQKAVAEQNAQEAAKQKNNAEEQTKVAESEKSKAQKNATIAEEQRKKAEEERKNADKERTISNRLKELVSKNLANQSILKFREGDKTKSKELALQAYELNKKMMDLSKHQKFIQLYIPTGPIQSTIKTKQRIINFLLE